ncbi:GtrA family protein [Phenylobacterium hankyongense]|uniref:GtrA family protein n=1 Tax=Phenylobacterium hankyongense TaxID=1813876 RepID=UPI001402932A|nr:GtrA family protein [Phenylobacterium hankyongense]
MTLARKIVSAIPPRLLRQFLSFASVGVAAVAVHYTVLAILVEVLGRGKVLSTTIGFFTGGAVSYSLNRWLTFDARPALAASFLKFLALIAIGGAINAAIVAALIRVGLHYLAAQVVATGVVLFWNFGSARLLVFGGARPGDDADEPVG